VAKHSGGNNRRVDRRTQSAKKKGGQGGKDIHPGTCCHCTKRGGKKMAIVVLRRDLGAEGKKGAGEKRGKKRRNKARNKSQGA